MTFRVQEAIHKWELGVGQRIVKFTAAILVFFGLAVWYDLRVFKGLSTPEGIDAAQLARKISRAHGYTTDFIRPFSIHLLRAQASAGGGREDHGTNQPRTSPGVAKEDPARLQGHHPDLANAPAYPVLLAGILKIMPFDYPDLLTAKSFSVFSADLWIAGFNQALLLLVLVMAYQMARKLFDETVAWLSVLAIGGTELVWHFTGTGHSTLLLMVLVLGLCGVLASLDRLARLNEAGTSQSRLLWLAAAAGLLAGLVGLTRYSFALLIIPTILWLAFLPSPKRGTVAVTTGLVFLAVMGPWLARNYILSGTPFGTATYAAAQGVGFFPADELERSLNADLNRVELTEIFRKTRGNIGELLSTQFSDFGGGWASSLFLVGLLVPFRNPTLGRLRWLVMSFLFVLLVAQAGGRTWLSQEAGSRSSENLLAVLAPPAFIFGAGLFAILLQAFVTAVLKWMAIGFFALLTWLPLLLTLAANHSLVLYPPSIQEKASSVGARELVMSDFPWAMAWYGDRPSVWLTLKHRDNPEVKLRNDFYEMHQLRPISALYLASSGLKAINTAEVAQWRGDTERQGEDWDKFLELAAALMRRVDNPDRREDVAALRRLLQLANQHWAYGAEDDWPGFLLGIYVNSEVPTGFPLKRAPHGLWPELFLTDSERNPAQ